jgi:sulfite exporter TauE/SafE
MEKLIGLFTNLCFYVLHFVCYPGVTHMAPNAADALSLGMLGLLGTGHCLGMCGPLVVALPGRFQCWNAHVLYHLGRLTTYTLVGVVLGGIGSGLAPYAAAAENPMAWLAHLQAALLVFAAIFLVVFGLMRMGIMREPDWLAATGPAAIPAFGRAVRSAMHHNKIPSLFFAGLMLGMLPCGLSYAAFARSLAAGSWLDGGLLTLCFGIGTLPGMLLLGTGASAFFRRYRVQTELAAGLLMITMALSLLVKVAA